MANWINTFIHVKKKKEQCQTARQPIQNYSGNILKERNSFLSLWMWVVEWMRSQGFTWANSTMELAGSVMVCWHPRNFDFIFIISQTRKTGFFFHIKKHRHIKKQKSRSIHFKYKLRVQRNFPNEIELNRRQEKLFYLFLWKGIHWKYWQMLI